MSIAEANMAAMACGMMVGSATEAAELLEKKGISLRMVDMFCIKPIDSKLVCRCARETGAIITAEEHNVMGGAAAPFGRVGMRDLHGECGPYKSLLKKYGVDAQTIANKVKNVLRK